MAGVPGLLGNGYVTSRVGSAWHRTAWRSISMQWYVVRCWTELRPVTFSMASENEFRMKYWGRSASIGVCGDFFHGSFSTYHATELVHGGYRVGLFCAVLVFLLDETPPDLR